MKYLDKKLIETLDSYSFDEDIVKWATRLEDEFDVNDLRKRINTEVSYYKPVFSTGFNAVNKIYADREFYDKVYKEVNDAEKIDRLNKNKAIIEMCSVFLANDASTFDDENYKYRDSIVESVCIESDTIEKIPNDPIGQMEVLEFVMDDINQNLASTMSVMDSYFGPGGNVNKTLGKEIPSTLSDEAIGSSMKYHEIEREVASSLDENERDRAAKVKKDNIDKWK